MRSLGAESCSVIGMLTHWTPLSLGIMITMLKSCNKSIRASFSQVSIVILSLASTILSLLTVPWEEKKKSNWQEIQWDCCWKLGPLRVKPVLIFSIQACLKDLYYQQ